MDGTRPEPKFKVGQAVCFTDISTKQAFTRIESVEWVEMMWGDIVARSGWEYASAANGGARISAEFFRPCTPEEIERYFE